MNCHPVRSVLVVRNEGKPEASRLSEEMGQWLAGQGIDVRIHSGGTTPGEAISDRPDLAVVLGGDGTMLSAASLLYEHETPLLGINLGTVGFITSAVKSVWRETLEAWFSGTFGLSYRTLLRVRVHRQGSEVLSRVALNEGVIAAQGVAKIVYLEVALSGVYLGEYRADGLIVATPTGSTAYSLAAGGPIVHPETRAILLTPICPHSLANRPIIVPDEEGVTVSLTDRQRTDVGLTVDGREFFPLEPMDEVRFTTAEKKALLVRSDRRSFYEVVREKLP